MEGTQPELLHRRELNADPEDQAIPAVAWYRP